jgi:hypothetical protein
MPTSTDLVTDLPADFEVFGQAVDTSLAELKGGTTGQVLSKTSNTDMDFTWVTTDDANAIQNSIVDAKGDLIAASANDTPARLGIGADYGFLMALGSASLGMTWQGGAWTDFAMTVGVQTGSLTTSTATSKYLRVGKMCVIRFVAQVTNIGTGSGYLTISLPFTVINDTAFAIGAGREDQLTGKMVQIQSIGNSTTARLYYYDNTNIIATNCKVQGLLVYEVA